MYASTESALRTALVLHTQITIKVHNFIVAYYLYHSRTLADAETASQSATCTSLH